MSYFDMINFEEASLLEGKQAEEYLKKKNNRYVRKLASMDNKYSTSGNDTHLIKEPFGRRAVDDQGRNLNNLQDTDAKPDDTTAKMILNLKLLERLNDIVRNMVI